MEPVSLPVPCHCRPHRITLSSVSATPDGGLPFIVKSNHTHNAEQNNIHGTAERKAQRGRIGTEEAGTGRKPAAKAGNAGGLFLLN